MKSTTHEPQRSHVSVDVLSAYIDGQITPAERAAVETHVADCSACRRELESLSLTVAYLQALPAAPVPRAFTLSEAQVGIRRPADRPAWLGGWLRGLGAVTALVLVAAVAVSLLRGPGTGSGNQTIALAPAAAPAPATPAARAVAPAASPVAEAPTTSQPAEVAVAMAAPSPTQASLQEAAPAPTAEVPAPEALAAKAAPEPAPAVAPELARSVAPEPSADAPPGMGEAGEAAGAASAAMLATGIGGEELLPPSAALAGILPEGAGVAFTGSGAVSAGDTAGGSRELATRPGAGWPRISPDRQWVAYGVQQGDHTEVWSIPWAGGEARLLLDDRELSGEGLSPDLGPRRVLDVRWAPGQNLLAVSTIALPAGTVAAPPKSELWNVDPASGEVRYVADLGRAARAAYAPDGSRFAVLQYGSEADPTGKLTLHNADGSLIAEALSFPAGPAKTSYEGQIAWLPGSDALWVAIPEGDPGLGIDSAGTALYRVSAQGDAVLAGSLQADQVAWSPDGSRLAYTVARPGDPVAALGFAAADGSQPAPYATMVPGAFLGWSPAGTRFLYADEGAIFAGGPGLDPAPLGSSTSVLEPRWAGEETVVHLQESPTGRALVLRDLAGAAFTVAELPADAAFDVALP
jgi:hypothetical protein